MPPAVRALFALLLAATLAGMGVARWAPVSPWIAAIAAGGLAALFGALLRLARWWWALLAAFPLATLAALQADLPGWAYAVAAAGLALTYGGVHRTQVPLFLSRPAVWTQVVALLPAPAPGRRYRFVDLGSAFGGLPRFVARKRPDVDAIGVEAAPLPALLASLRQALAPVRGVTLRRGDLWTEPVGDADLVFAFLSPVPMPALWRKLAQELPPGSCFVSCEFPVPEVTALRVVDGAHRRLHVYAAPRQA